MNPKIINSLVILAVIAIANFLEFYKTDYKYYFIMFALYAFYVLGGFIQKKYSK